MKTKLLILLAALAAIAPLGAQTTIMQLPLLADDISLTDKIYIVDVESEGSARDRALALGALQSFLQTSDAWKLAAEDGDSLAPGEPGIGWADGFFTIQTPVGALQFFETGAPLEPTIYWPGVFEVDTISANLIQGVFSGAQITSGQIPDHVMQASVLTPMRHWYDSPTGAGANGLTYAATGPGGVTEPTTPGRYFPTIDVIDGDPNWNELRGQIRTAAQLRTDLGVAEVVAAPATASSTGTAGQVAFDANYLYRCTATNTWKRVALSTW